MCHSFLGGGVAECGEVYTSGLAWLPQGHRPNPNTNEVIETKGGNHKWLKEWKADYGSEAVEPWAS